MNCEQANEIDLIDYLAVLGHHAIKIRGNDYWYVSPLRDEKDPSFKVSKVKNVWYDFGQGKGGSVVDFIMLYFNCDVKEALQKIVSFHPQQNAKNIIDRPPLQRHHVEMINVGDATATALTIVAAKKPITDTALCRYLTERRIDKTVADSYCCEVAYTLHDKTYNAIGFKNTAGGYELRSAAFKGSSSPKYVTYLDNKANNITVFEGFFDFMSYQTIYCNQQQPLTSFQVLNSLSFFERSLLLLEKHEQVHLYLDHDEAGRKCTSFALKRHPCFVDESHLYKGYKDLNDWMTNMGKGLQKTLGHRIRF